MTTASPADLSADVAAKRDRLLAVVGGLPSAAVALSGGVDSGVVAAAAARVLGGRAVAVTADSPSVPRAELAAAAALARAVGIRHVVVPTAEFADPDYVRNAGDRCYFCKSELYRVIGRRLADLGAAVVLSGANVDDAGDFRPGLTAAAEHGVRHPLQEAGLTKADVRAVARHWGLAVADKLAAPCLASRLAPGVAVTPERVARVEAAERYLASLGVGDGRVRYHEGDVARVEVPAADIARLTADPVRGELSARLKGLGFRFVAVDLDGFRPGSLNALVSLEVRGRFAGRPPEVDRP